jgi:hypothetical protein
MGIRVVLAATALVVQSTLTKLHGGLQVQVFLSLRR